MGWNTDIEPKRAGWYFCTIEYIGRRFVIPLFRYKYLVDIFRWKDEPMGEIIAVCPFPEPYSGCSKKEITKDINKIFGGDF